MRPYKKLWWPRFRPFFWVVDELKPTKRGPRGASNYGLFIIVRKTSPEWQIQQEIYESRYWLRHPWRLVDFFWFYKVKAGAWLYRVFVGGEITAFLAWEARRKKAAAHLASVECQSRAQEIRARWEDRIQRGEWDKDRDSWIDSWAHEYARSIHGASNYPYIKVALWDEERVYQEILKHL